MTIGINLILDLVERLREAKIFYSIRCTRQDAISIDVSVPGQRWEIDFLEDGTLEIEIFASDGNIYDNKKLSELFDIFSN